MKTPQVVTPPHPKGFNYWVFVTVANCRFYLESWFSGYDMMPNSKGIKSAGAYNEKGLKGGVLSPEQLSATPQAITEGAAPVSPEPTRGIRVMVTQDKYQKLPSPVPQRKSNKQTPLVLQATPEPAPAIPQGKGPKPAPEPRPEPGPMGPQGKAPKTNPAPQPQGKYPKPESVQNVCGRKE